MTNEPPVALPGVSFWARAVVLVLVHPSLWLDRVAAGAAARPPRWWARPPFLPLPDPDYLRFRFETQYGAGRAGPTPTTSSPISNGAGTRCSGTAESDRPRKKPRR